MAHLRDLFSMAPRECGVRSRLCECRHRTRNAKPPCPYTLHGELSRIGSYPRVYDWDADMNSDERFKRSVEFDADQVDEEAFARGFDAGNINGLLRGCPDDYELVVFAYATNAEMILRLAERYDRRVITRDVTDDAFLEAAFSPVAQQPAAGRWER